MTKPMLLCLAGEDLATSELGRMLARDHTLMPVTAGHEAGSGAASVIAQAQSAGVQSFALLSSRDQCALALQIAALKGDDLQALILLAPQALDENGGAQDGVLATPLADIKAQTLVVFGTRDTLAPPQHAGRYKQALPACHIMLVYDAADLERERADAVFEAVNDFLKRREGFLVNNLDGKIFA